MQRVMGPADGTYLGTVKCMTNGKIVQTVKEQGRIQMENSEWINEFWQALNWRIMKHNHTNVLSVIDTCPLCVIEQALYGGKK